MLMAQIDRRITAVYMDHFKGDVRLKLPLCKEMDNLTEVATLENDGFVNYCSTLVEKPFPIHLNSLGTEILMLYFR